MPVTRDELTGYLNHLFSPENFQDYGPNGLQIEGKEKIKKIGFSVSATRQSVTLAATKNCDALFVHHGLFWNFHGVRTLTGTFANRVKPLIKNDINLYGYHLPLDAHVDLGNAASLAKKLHLEELNPFGEYKKSFLGVSAKIPGTISAQQLQKQIAEVLKHPVILASEKPNEIIKSIGIITGGANRHWRQAKALGLDAYLTGEISEHDWHEAQESGIHYFAGGHHATEQFGVQTVMTHLQNEFNIEVEYFDSANPA